MNKEKELLLDLLDSIDDLKQQVYELEDRYYTFVNYMYRHTDDKEMENLEYLRKEYKRQYNKIIEKLEELNM